jgi:hypothetical protein
MTGSHSTLRALAAFAVAGLLAGCAGAGSAPPTSSSAPLGVFRAACKVDHGVSVKPCSLSLSWSETKATVTTSGPKGGVFSFNDKKCAAEDVATVSGSGNSYVVTWGTKSGSCSVVFTDKASGKTIGTAKLSIKNTV